MNTLQDTSIEGLKHQAMRIIGVATRLINEAETRGDGNAASQLESAKRFAMEATQLIGVAQDPSSQHSLDRRASVGVPMFHLPSAGVTGGVTSVSAARVLLDKAEELLRDMGIVVVPDLHVPANHERILDLIRGH